MQHQNALLLSSLHRYKAHGWSRDRLADGGRVRRIVLIALNIMRWHQFDLMPSASISRAQ